MCGMGAEFEFLVHIAWGILGSVGLYTVYLKTRKPKEKTVI
jgi:hypothetical protein